MKLLWYILCSRIITDSQTNTISYIDCIEEIQTANLPVKLALCSIGSLWEKSVKGKDYLKVRIMLEMPSGHCEQIIETDNIEIDKDRHRLNFMLDGFPVKEPGKYKFQVESYYEDTWKPAFEVGFKVNLIKVGTKEKIIT